MGIFTDTTGWQTKALWTGIAVLGAVSFAIVALNRGDDQPRGIDRFAPVERDNRERNRAQYSDPCP